MVEKESAEEHGNRYAEKSVCLLSKGNMLKIHAIDACDK